MLSMLGHLLDTVLKVKSTMVMRVQNGLSVLVVHPGHHLADWELFAALLSIPAALYCICLAPNRPKFKVHFLLNVYYFPFVVKLKNC